MSPHTVVSLAVMVAWGLFHLWKKIRFKHRDGDHENANAKQRSSSEVPRAIFESPNEPEDELRDQPQPEEPSPKQNTEDCDNLDELFNQAWDEVDNMTDKERAERFPWSQNLSEGVPPNVAADVLENLGRDEHSSQPRTS